MSSAPVTIVGAGPSGLTLAWWLIERGHTVTVLEREPAVPKDMRASTFHPATLDLLADSGLADALVARGTMVPEWQYLIHESGERAVFDMACLSDVTAYPFRLQCEQFQLTELLAARLTEHPSAGQDCRCRPLRADTGLVAHRARPHGHGTGARAGRPQRYAGVDLPPRHTRSAR